MSESIAGSSIAQTLNAETKLAIKNIHQKTNIPPTLAMITVGSEEVLKTSEFMLHVDLAKKLGINVESIILNESATQAEILQAVDSCNCHPGIHGILVLLPLPEHIDEATVLARVADKKELEGLNEIKTMATMFEGKQISLIASLLRILEELNYDILKYKNVLLIEDSFFHENPVVQKLLQAAKNLGIPLDIVTTKNKAMSLITSKADLLLVSTETPEFVNEHYIKSGAIVLDFNPIAVGEVYSEEKQKLVPILKSSVNVDSAKKKAKHIIPCLGGIGPIALATLMLNFLFNYKNAVLKS